MANVVSIERLNEHARVEHLDDGTRRLTLQRGQNYFDRDTNRFEDSPAGVTADAQVPGFSHRYKAQHWSRFGRGQWKIGFGQGRSITYRPRGAIDVAPVSSGHVVTYRDLWPGVDIQLTAFPEGVKEDLVLKAPGGPSSFTFDVELSGVIIVQDGHSLQVLDTMTGQPIGRVPAPTVHDAAGVSGPVTQTYSAGAITIAAGSAWLADPKRPFPVTLDPTTLTIQPDAAAGLDTYLDASGPSGNFGTATTMDVGWYNNPTTPYPRRPILKFTNLGVGSGGTIQSAVLHLYCVMTTGSIFSGTMDVRRITADWDELQATWNNRLSATAWTTPGGDYAAAVEASVNFQPPVAAWQTWTITALVQAWLSGTYPNFGLLLRHSLESGGASSTTYAATFYSSDYATDATLRPKLVVTYAEPTVTVTSPNGAQATPTQISNQVSGFNLSGVYNSAGNVNMAYRQHQIYDEIGNLIWDSSKTAAAAASGATVTISAPAGYLKYGKKYRWRWMAWDINGGASVWSADGWFQSSMAAPAGLTATADSANAKINLTWTAHPGENLAGYNLYRKLQGAPDADYKKVNLSLLTGLSTTDDTAASAQGYTYALTAVATGGYESVKSTGVNGSVTFTGYWIAATRIKLREAPHFSRDRRASRRLALDGSWQVQDQGFAAPQVELTIRFANLAERDSILALFPADTAVSYRDEQGFVLRGKVAGPADEERLQTGTAVYGVIRVTLTEVSS